MQTFFLKDEQHVNKFRYSLSDARLTSYLKVTGGDSSKAIELYYWNTILAQSLYISLQMWEIGLRNKLNNFLSWKYGANWPFDPVKAVRQLHNNDKGKLNKAIVRQRQFRGGNNISTGSVVADLSAGFWVSLLGKKYDVPFSWHYNLHLIFPEDQGLDRETASQICGRLLDLRNRVAHHEPIHYLPLEELRKDADRVLKAMCPVAHRFATTGCTFHLVLAQRPQL